MMNQALQHFRNKALVRRELIAAFTTFLTMAYIVFVNPQILGSAGMDIGAVFTATCLVSALGSLMLGFMSDFPIAIAPGMALNVYFSYIVVGTFGYDWQNALGMVFISGVLFLLLTLTKLRAHIIRAIPYNLNIAIGVGIGLLIAVIALKNNGIITQDNHTLLKLGDLHNPQAFLFILGFLIIVSLDFLQIPGAIIIGVLAISVISWLSGLKAVDGWLSMPPSITPTLFKFQFNELNHWQAWSNVFTFFLVALFDATGTLLGVLNHSSFKRGTAKVSRLSKALFADSSATTLGAVLGTSSTSPFIESTAGIEAGGRTGLTAIFVGLLFLVALFFYPLAKAIPNYAVGPALLFVACAMFKEVKNLEVSDKTEVIPAIVTILLIPFSFSIADGLGLGLLCYVFLKIITGQYRSLNLSLSLLGLVFLLFFILF